MVTNASIILMMILGSYLSWNRYGGPGPELLLFVHAGLQVLIWWLAKRGKLIAAFAIPLIWFMIELAANAALLLMTYAGDTSPSPKPPEPSHMQAAELIGYFTIAGLFGGHLWMAIDLGRKAINQNSLASTISENLLS